VGIPLAYDQILADLVPLTPLESVDHAGRNPHRPQQDHQTGGEVFAVARFALEEKVLQGVEAGVPPEVQAVPQMFDQVRLHCPDRVDGGFHPDGQRARQRADARGQRRELQIDSSDLGGIVARATGAP
jgi:hypothetical protein